jgi:hypothetical protein
MSALALSALSGFGWGVIAVLIGRAAFGHRIWVGFVASPVIGILIGRLSRPLDTASPRAKVIASLFHLYIAAICFGLALAGTDLVSRPPQVKFLAMLVQNVLAVLWGLTFTGYVFVLWPLSYLNHKFIWNADESPGPPEVKIGPDAVRTFARTMIQLSLLGYGVWVVFDLLTASASPGPWWYRTGLMGWAKWFVVGSFLWITAPIMSSVLRRTSGSRSPEVATYGGLISLLGFAIIVFPILLFAATWIIAVVKVSLVQSWATEGTVFVAARYYRNVVLGLLPGMMVGASLIVIGRLVRRAEHSRV